MFSLFKKKDIVGYPKSFAKRLTRHIMLRMTIIMSIPVIILFFITYEEVFGLTSYISKSLLNGRVNEIRRISSDLYVAATNTAPYIRDDLKNPDKMYTIMERMLKLNPYIHSCGISFRENYYPEKGRWFCPYVVRNDSNVIEQKTLGGESYDYLNAEWFQQALSKKEGQWSAPFFDDADKKTPLVSYMVPILDDRDSTVAILGVDMSLAWLSDKIQLEVAYSKEEKEHPEEWTAEYKAYFFMVDSMGTILIHPQKNRLIRQKLQTYMDAPDDDDDIHQLDLNKVYESQKTYLEGERVLIRLHKIKYTDWTMGLAIPMFIIDLFGYVIASIFILFIILCILVVYFSGRRAIKRTTKPLRQLATSANEVAKGNFNTPLPQMDSHDEIHMLRDSFENMQHSLTRYVKELKATTAEKAVIESELTIAHNIQMAMLPKTFPPYPERHDIEIFGQLTPAKAVGGDLFDFHIRDEKLFFCIGDVSGKGVPASLVMAVTRTLFRNVSAHALAPNEIISALNNTISDGNDMNMFVTLFVGVLDLTNGQLRYSNAGHDAPLLISKEVSTLPCDSNLPIGIMPDFQYTVQETTLQSDTTIFLYTDGLTEAENSRHQLFGDARVISSAKEAVSQNITLPNMLIQHMAKAVSAFVGNAEQSDDLTMLSIQYKKIDA